MIDLGSQNNMSICPGEEAMIDGEVKLTKLAKLFIECLNSKSRLLICHSDQLSKIESILNNLVEAIHPNFKLLNNKTVKKIKNNGFKIYSWTVNDKDDINFMKKLKVDGIISDYPEKI